ncbi:GTPase domain-containing protein [Fontimonas sp. SYSU GA230001]|uniref:GTPase family protein n=1 Tax=Fontimonas sp. SYSU GA230001 TaxID=3142450 RepID=UPI0032B57796
MDSPETRQRQAWRQWAPLLWPYAVAVLPVALLVVAGAVALWRSGLALAWVVTLLVCGIAAWLLLHRGRQRVAATLPRQAADPAWAASTQGAWALIDARAENLRASDWPAEASGIYTLARDVIADVARHFHPDALHPMAEVTLPHALLIIEAASHDLRTEVLGVIPFAHRLKLADLGRVQSLYEIYEQVYDLYRAGRLIVNPLGAVATELTGALRNRAFNAAKETLQVWLLRQWVRKVGYHAIALYSGQAVLSAPEARPTAATAREIDQAMREAAQAEPLRLLLVGRSGAGKSSLINALFDTPLAATDVHGITGSVRPYVLERDGWPAALVVDTPGCDSAAFGIDDVLRELERADALLVVVAAPRADRSVEHELLQTLRRSELARTRGLPPLFVALTQIDRLPPAREWSPPYDLGDATRAKARSIAGAVAAVAADLAVPADRVVPVCVRGGYVYNVEDALLGAIGAALDDVKQARLRRCVATQRRAENWALLREQLLAAGRLLNRALPRG